MSSRSTRLMMAFSVPMLAAAHARAEDWLGISHETYLEDGSRMAVETESIRYQQTFGPTFDLAARGVFDAISGATPIGAPAINQLKLTDSRTHLAIPSSAITGFARPVDGVSGASPARQATAANVIPLAKMSDDRLGLDVAPGFNYGSQRFVPEISFSAEDDYLSFGLALNYSIALNDKNTILNAGWSHDYDLVESNRFTYINHTESKNTDDFILGVTQLLSPGTVFSVNGTFEHAGGYLNDPYLGVVFDQNILNSQGRVVLTGEKRPSTRNSEGVLLTLTQSVSALDASIEGTYRFYNDSYGILAHTLGLAWYQKLGQSWTLSPSVRYYHQSAANFYGIQFPGNPATDAAAVPQFYSSDYRLSKLNTFTVGFEATYRLKDRWDIHAGYQRYWMRGLDNVTMQSTYPSANIFTVGLTYNF